MRPARIVVERSTCVLALSYRRDDRSALFVGFTLCPFFIGEETVAVLTGENRRAVVEKAGLIVVCNKAAVNLVERTYPIIALYRRGIFSPCILRAIEENILLLRAVFSADGQ